MNQPTEQEKSFRTMVGGQAVIEGIMMRGKDKAAIAVRKEDGSIAMDEWNLSDSPALQKAKKIPIVRGVISFISSLWTGYQSLNKSVELSGMTEDLEPESKFEKWLDKHFGDKLTKIITVVASVVGVAVAIFLFMYLPTLAVTGLSKLFDLGVFKSVIEGVIKIGIFVLYMFLVSRMKDIQRMFAYHGAEHKTIFCYEAGEELTVENVRKFKRFHPRCGTSFLIITLIISVIAFAVVTWSSPLLRVLLKFLMLPLVMGVSFECIRYAGRHDNWLTKILSAPGVWMQHLTTNEPDDSMIEVAIAALKPVLPEKREEMEW
jgi:uncharacterized protein YqhQ